MPQTSAWESEYRKPKLMTGSDEPVNDVKRYLKFLKKEERTALDGLHVLDLGSGTGRNTNYLASEGCIVTGYEISKTATRIAKEQAEKAGNSSSANFLLQSIGDPYPSKDASFDLILDITSSNSLSEKERGIYLKECYRVLKPGGHIFVRSLCKDGDANAKNLLKLHPGTEPDTYINPSLGLTERVFSKEDFIATYTPYFSIQNLEKKTGYARLDGRIYKRNYWLAYMKRV